MSYPRKTWYNKGHANQSRLDADAFNDFEGRIEKGFNDLEQRLLYKVIYENSNGGRDIQLFPYGKGIYLAITDYGQGLAIYGDENIALLSSTSTGEILQFKVYIGSNSAILGAAIKDESGGNKMFPPMKKVVKLISFN